MKVSRPVALGAVVPVVAAAALPWAWFPLRDVLGVVGDVIAILFPVLVAALVVGALVAARRRRRWLLPAASVLALGVVAVVGPWLPADAGPVAAGRAVTVASANVTGMSESVGSLLATSADVLVVAEMSASLEEPLAAAYPYRRVALAGPAVAVYSRFPMRVLDEPGPDLPGLRVEIDGPAGPFVVYGLHVPRPWLTTVGGYQATVAEHHAIMTALAARVATETLPVVLAGDLNSPDRGRDYRRLVGPTGMVDAARDGPVTFSSTGQWTVLLLRIDHILVTPGWCGDAAHQIDLPGSDHRGVTATVGPCAAAAAPTRDPAAP